jgi:hypothetical protein
MSTIANRPEENKAAKPAIPKISNDGPEGVDKAPGEETAQSTDDINKLAQKGKKVDEDLSLESDQPIEIVEI